MNVQLQWLQTPYRKILNNNNNNNIVSSSSQSKDGHLTWLILNFIKSCSNLYVLISPGYVLPPQLFNFLITRDSFPRACFDTLFAVLLYSRPHQPQKTI
jgi:hypothetical protein